MRPEFLVTLKRTLVIIFSSVVLAACGDGDGPDSISATPPAVLPPETGVLLDSPVEGVTWETSSGLAGETNTAGQFEYALFDRVTFSIGDIILGSAPAAPYITPVELTNSPDPTAQAALNMLVFLQSIDADQNPSNGIFISPATRAAAVGQTLDFFAPDFATQLARVVAAITEPDNRIVTEQEALNNFYETYRNIGGPPLLDFPFPGYPPVGSIQYELIFQDEFNTGTAPNPEIWNYDIGYGPNNFGWGNDEWQLYTDSPENIKVEDGNLVITARCPVAPCGVRDGSITSARITTTDKFEFRYGKIIARIKVPTGKGTWPAFWALGANFPEIGWPRSGEIDFMEVFNNSYNTPEQSATAVRTATSAMHWCDETIVTDIRENCFPRGRIFTKGELTLPNPLDQDFAIWEADWDANGVTVSINGTPYYQQDIDPATMEEFQREFFLLLNVAIGGTLGSGQRPPTGDEIFPQTMLVDYVRVFQQVATGPTVIDFEDPPGTYDFGPGGGFEGGVSDVITNPVAGGINTSSQVARMRKFAGEVFAGSTLALPTPLEISSPGTATMKVWSQRPVNVLLKLESSADIELDVPHGGSGWEELSYDFSSFTGAVEGVTVIFDLGTVGDADNDPVNWTFYYDDITLPTGTGGGPGDPPPSLTSVRIASNNADPGLAKAGDRVTVSFTANEPIVTPTVTIGGLAASTVSGAGTVWQASRILTESDADGAIGFTINYVDLASNAGIPVSTTTDASLVIVDSTPPVVSIPGAPASFATLDPIGLTFQFSEAVNGFGLSDIEVTNGAVGNLAGDGATYTADATPNGLGSLVVSVPGAAATDPAGNPSDVAADVVVTSALNPDAPLLTGIAISSNNAFDSAYATAGDTVTLSITANEDVTQPTVVIAGGAATVTGSGTTWSASRTLTGAEPEGPIAFSISGFADLGGTPGFESTVTTNGSAVIFDVTAPAVSIQGLPAGAIQALEPIELTFQFDEAVTGFAEGDIDVTNGTVSNFAAVDATTYTADVEPDGQGDLTVAVAGGAAVDVAGIPSAAASETRSVSATVWRLIWSDQFNGGSLNAANWTARTDIDCPVPCEGVQNYLAERVSVADGVLTIEARDEGGAVYTSGLIDTRDKLGIRYGRVEIDALMPGTLGTLPSLFLLPVNENYGPWPQSGEIDILNAPNLLPGISTLEHTLRYGLPEPEDTETTKTSEPLTEPTLSFIQYAIEWEGGEIRWFVDDVHVATQIQDNWYTYFEDADGLFGLGEGAAPFDDDFYLAIGLGIGNNAGATSTFPQQLQIEAVRVYECNNPTNPELGTGCSTGTGVPPEDAPGAPFTDIVDLYADGPATLGFEAPGGSTTPGALEPQTFNFAGAVTTSSPNASDGANTIWNVNVSAASGSGGVILTPAALSFGSGYFDFAGGETAGEVLFRLRVNSATAGAQLRVGLRDDPGEGEQILSYTADGVWRNYSVKIGDLIADSVLGGTPLDISDIEALVVTAQSGAINFDLDDISVKVACRDDGGCEATPKLRPPPPTIQFEENFDSLGKDDPNALGDTGWLIFGAVFDSAGTFKFGYGAFPAPNNPSPPGWAAIVDDQGGVEQGTQQLSIFSDYNCCQPGQGHFNGTDLVESNIFREWTIGAAGGAFPSLDTTVTFSFDAKKGNIEGTSEAIAFIKTLDPDAGFATTNFVIVDTTNLPDTWGRYSVSLDLTDPLLEGQLLQVGFATTTSNFQGTGVFYDNLEVGTTAVAP
jgi:beta-glucanase (GH16 family)